MSVEKNQNGLTAHDVDYCRLVWPGCCSQASGHRASIPSFQKAAEKQFWGILHPEFPAPLLVARPHESI